VVSGAALSGGGQSFTWKFFHLVRKALFSLTGIVAMIGMWQLTIAWTSIPDYLLPSPGDVLDVFTTSPGFILSNARATATEIVVGLAIGVAGALIWAILLIAFDPVRRAVFPLMVAAQSAPKEAMAPIFIIWWGFSSLPKIVMAALVSFFPMLIATVVGLERFTEQHRLLALSMGAGPIRTFFSFRIWTALPSFLSGVRLGVTLAVIGAVLGEYLGSDQGLGYLILGSSRRLNGALLYASLIALMAMSWTMVALVNLLETILLRGTGRGRFLA
jgi:NitT/TauT family transport system permease protein